MKVACKSLYFSALRAVLSVGGDVRGLCEGVGGCGEAGHGRRNPEFSLFLLWNFAEEWNLSLKGLICQRLGCGKLSRAAGTRNEGIPRNYPQAVARRRAYGYSPRSTGKRKFTYQDRVILGRTTGKLSTRPVENRSRRLLPDVTNRGLAGAGSTLEALTARSRITKVSRRTGP